MFGKPVQLVVGEDFERPIRIDVSAIPMKRERVGWRVIRLATPIHNVLLLRTQTLARL
jgi:hypothetical protein